MELVSSYFDQNILPSLRYVRYKRVAVAMLVTAIERSSLRNALAYFKKLIELKSTHKDANDELCGNNYDCADLYVYVARCYQLLDDQENMKAAIKMSISRSSDANNNLFATLNKK